MADDTTNRGPRERRERSRNNFSEDDEVRYWTDKLGISTSQLEDVVRKVGSSATAANEEFRSTFQPRSGNSS